MLYLAHKIINKEEAKDFKDRLMNCNEWIDGRETALGRAKDIKRNLQLKAGDSYSNFSQEIFNFLNKNKYVQLYAMPRKIFSILFSRTGVGMFYGPHGDMPYSPNGRRDLSFTLFLNEPDEYEGGELILNIPPMIKKVKLNAGEIIIYPTKYLHEVSKVTDGERVVCVGWIQSQISNDTDRETLYNLKMSLTKLKKTDDRQSIFNMLNLTYLNLYKRFLD